QFVKVEVALKSPEQWRDWQLCLCRLIESTLKHGLPMEQLGIKTFAQMKEQSRNADECLLVMLSACSDLTGKVSEIDWPSKVAFGDWIKQLQGQREDWVENHLALFCLQYINLSKCILYVQDLYEANLEFSVFNDAELGDIFLESAKLNSAELKAVELEGADLTGANLVDANLTGANLAQANLLSTDFFGANFTDANLTGADLTDANLTDSNLTNTDLTDAIYDKAQFTPEQLQQAKHLNPENH
ncbi:MAG: pentapeptide repeat-containing protein, partial [Psychrosphaera sp.]|nr:pentapeptide repeat-containing protein [Psychrosphaera sp.]